MERVAKTLRYPALNLTINGARVDGASHILHHPIGQKLHKPCFWINRKFTVMYRENRHVQCLDHMPRTASWHGLHAGSGKGATTGDRSGHQLCSLGYLRDRNIGPGYSLNIDLPILQN